MLARDFSFHSIQHQQQQPPMTVNNQAPFQRHMTIPTMQHLSIGASIQQQEPSYQLDRHSLSYSESTKNCGSNPDSQMNPRTIMDRSQSITTMNRGQSTASSPSTPERNYSNPDVQISPRSLALLNRLENKHHHVPLNAPPASLRS